MKGYKNNPECENIFHPKCIFPKCILLNAYGEIEYIFHPKCSQIDTLEEKEILNALQNNTDNLFGKINPENMKPQIPQTFTQKETSNLETINKIKDKIKDKIKTEEEREREIVLEMVKSQTRKETLEEILTIFKK